MNNIDSIISQIQQQLEECEKRAYNLYKKVSEYKSDLDYLTREIRNKVQMEIIKHFDRSYSLDDLHILSKDVRKIYEAIEKYRLEINDLETLIKDYIKNINKIRYQLEECRKKGDIKTLNEIIKKVGYMQVLINEYEEKLVTIKQQIHKILEILV